MAGVIKTGMTSWVDKSLLASGFYPRGAKTAEGRLRYYASQFCIVENDSAYYALPARRHAELWVERTPPDFTMNVKAFASLTGHYTDPRRLPADLRKLLPESVAEKRRVYPKDLGPELLTEIGQRFRDAIEPLRASGRLGVVLFQYPVWFPRTRENEDLVKNARETVPGCRVAVEFRNATWMADDRFRRTLAFLRENELVYTCVDEPQGFTSSVPPIAEATSDIALVRFHGRNGARWEKAATTASERFQYLYSLEDLVPWVPKIQRLAEETRAVHVLMNNCWQDYAVVNAREMAALLAGEALPPRGAG
jgi:uncharacterized protein YecE (DUF72 family)